ncbi:hypothetical protein I302_100036 [Kwoniella bestiolae CBS 10118]|uniref:Uncharacterized protein n=1 Tax=Kwoniella bestiolae CBS 10118 TaxID=1296100 RepID=A0A1B9G3X4_9TREE|nr:hypothetical protein I302_03408 [Kwoniella bestiolae CBS 10118]OCF25735.1 hypothetical protein I302_03408 [Kwoniella bestiolae CBS 10118]
MPDLDRTGDYKDIKPTKIRMKETKAEKADRLYRKEQHRQARESARISRANGYAVSPPRRGRSESISPPRKQSRRTYNDDVDGELGQGQGEWMGGYGRRAREELERREWEDKINWMAGNVDDPFGSGFGGFDEDIHIPKRFREAAGLGIGGSSRAGRRAVDEVLLDGGPTPPLGRMNDEEYSSWVREGMYRLKHRDEVDAAERRRKAREEKERLKEVERERAEREEQRRIKRLKKQKGEDEERKRTNERSRWRERWKLLGERDAEVVDIDMSFNDIPWPIYRPSSSTTIEHLSIDNIRTFVHAVAEDTAEDGKVDIRKTIREAIRNYHPDRFNSRILVRVKEKDKGMVKEGVGVVSGILNDLVREIR